MCFNHHVAANVSDVTNVARIMLARSLLRLAGSQQASFASNTFSRFKSSSPWPSVASIKGCPFHAGRLPRLQSLQTPSYRAQAGMGFLYSNLTAPLLKKFATPVAGSPLSRGSRVVYNCRNSRHNYGPSSIYAINIPAVQLSCLEWCPPFQGRGATSCLTIKTDVDGIDL